LLLSTATDASATGDTANWPIDTSVAGVARAEVGHKVGRVGKVIGHLRLLLRG